MEMANHKLSKLAENLTLRSVSKLSEKIDKKNQQGGKIFNFTLGDFLPQQFAIPSLLEEEIIKAYKGKNTNYPFVSGVEELRTAISEHIKYHGQFEYQPEDIIVASGARPLIYLLFKTLVDPGEKIIYTTPSWNTQYFIYLANAIPVVITTKPENGFLITASDLKPYIKEAVLININSPLNPCGTILSKHALQEIFDLIVEENIQRSATKQKPLYVFFDIIYWFLVYNEIQYINPISLNPKIKDYIVFVDGISKCFAATGVRVGWAFGPQTIIEKMRSISAHLGAWAPKPEQIGTAKYLKNYHAVTTFLSTFKKEIFDRLNIFYITIQKLKNAGYKVDAIEPQGALYLSIKLDIIGAKTKDNKTLANVEDILEYLLEEAKTALVPFYFFGMDENMPWFRLSAGTCSTEEAKTAANLISHAIQKLSVT